MNKLLLILSLALASLVASCGGGSSSSADNRAANVTDQCQRAVPVNTFENSCDFAVNANIVFIAEGGGRANNIARNVQPGETLYFFIDRRPDIVIICRAPYVPSDDSLRCT